MANCLSEVIIIKGIFNAIAVAAIIASAKF
jgi:hypothetical protein